MEPNRAQENLAPFKGDAVPCWVCMLPWKPRLGFAHFPYSQEIILDWVVLLETVH